MTTFSFSSDSGDLASSLQGERESGVGCGELFEERRCGEGANDSRGGGSRGFWGFIPRDGLGSAWIGLDAFGQGCGALGTTLWTLSISANQSVGIPLLWSQGVLVQSTCVVIAAWLRRVGA
jgi:hypothetical protein